MYWANFLHIYQPPTQSREILLKVTNESYRKVLAGLLENPTAKMTLNINGVLTEMLATHGCLDVIEQIRTLLERGQLELTGSAKFHPLLPRLPDQHIIRQIQLNTETNRKYFGKAYQPKGFFPPEMGLDARVAGIVHKLGFTWLIGDESGCPVPLNPSKRFVDSKGMGYFFREREMSFKILSAQLGTADSLIHELGNRLENNEYLLTAMDGETFGHHRLGLEQLLVDIYHSSKLQTVRMSELLELFPETTVIQLQPSTWALMPKNTLKKLPFARWDDPTNPIHKKQWELTNLVLQLAEKESPDKQALVDRCLYSDQYWWASAKPWWSLEMIEQGAYELVSAVEKFTHVLESDRKVVKELYLQIITTGFEWQRNGTVAKLSRAGDEEILTRMTEDRAQLSQNDFEQMIASLQTQMQTAADNYEYSRAESFQKRIKELTDEMNKIPTDHSGDVKVNQ